MTDPLLNMKEMLDEISVAIEHATFERKEEHQGYSLYQAISNGWKVTYMGNDQHGDGAAAKDLVIVHLTPALVAQIQKKLAA